MSRILSQISSSSTKQEGLRFVLSGVEKIGKTTLACGSPGALLIPLEVGYSGVSVHKTPMLADFNDVLLLLDEIIQQAQHGEFTFKSIIFDSATALERLIHNAVLTTDPLYANGNKKGLIMDNALGGYGKAYNFANELFDKFLKKCDLLAVNAGINIILTCHVFPAKIIDPSSGEYDSWDLLLHSPKNQKAYGKREMLTQWADIIGFLHEPIFVSKTDNITRGISANKGRVLAVNRTPSYTAGNRFSLTEDIAIPREDGWNHLAHALFGARGIDVYKR